MLLEFIVGAAVLAANVYIHAKDEGGVDNYINKTVEKTAHDLSRNTSVSPEKRAEYKTISDEYKAERYMREQEERKKRYEESLEEKENQQY